MTNTKSGSTTLHRIGATATSWITNEADEDVCTCCLRPAPAGECLEVIVVQDPWLCRACLARVETTARLLVTALALGPAVAPRAVPPRSIRKAVFDARARAAGIRNGPHLRAILRMRAS